MTRSLLLFPLKCFLVAVLIVVIAQPTKAQTEAGSISGMVTDPSGAALPATDLILTDI